MKKSMLLTVSLFIFLGKVSAQEINFEKFNFLLGSGFGNEKSIIHSEFKLIMGGKYLEIKNNSMFDPTESKPEGENHIDWGILSFDKNRDRIIYRQFNNEGYFTSIYSMILYQLTKL